MRYEITGYGTRAEILELIDNARRGVRSDRRMAELARAWSDLDEGDLVVMIGNVTYCVTDGEDLTGTDGSSRVDNPVTSE